MRLTLLCVLVLLVAASGCRRDVGIPDDWATEPIPPRSHEVTETTCGDALPQEWLTSAVFIEYHWPRPGEAEVGVRFTDTIRTSCDPTEQPDGTFDLDCESNDRLIVNLDSPRDCRGYAEISLEGTFTGPRSATFDFVYDVFECPCEEACAPFPGTCTVAFTVDYADP